MKRKLGQCQRGHGPSRYHRSRSGYRWCVVCDSRRKTLRYLNDPDFRERMKIAARNRYRRIHGFTVDKDSLSQN